MSVATIDAHGSKLVTIHDLVNATETSGSGLAHEVLKSGRPNENSQEVKAHLKESKKDTTQFQRG